MRPQLIVLLCTTGAACGITFQAFGQSASPLAFTLDLMAPCSGSTCSGTHPTDSGFQTQAAAFQYTAGSDANGAYGLATLQGLTAPMVCDEVALSSSGASGSSRFAPEYANASLSGGVLDFNNFSAGGDTVVDLSSLIYDGSNPAGVAASYSNFSSPQVTCYNVNPVTGGARSDAPGPSGTIFHTGFEDHYADEPWVSVQTVNSPNATAGSAPTSPGAPTPANTFAYVVQIHNASHAAGWRLMLGYDHAYFSTAASGTAPWACVLGSSIPQPGSTGGTCNSVSVPYTLKAADIQSATNSIYVYVDNTGSNAASTNWSAMSGAFYPAVAAVFPPFGTYPQRFDDKTAVASANNMPKVNITNVVCNNDVTSTSCQVYGPESGANGGGLPPGIVYTNTISSAGALSVDPVVYVADPYGGNTLPGNAPADVLTNQGTLSNPNAIFGPGGGFSVSTNAQGALQYNATFRKVGGVYVAGTATYAMTFLTATSGYKPRLATAPQIFTVTMLPTSATHFAVTASASATAGNTTSFTVTALDAVNNAVPTYSGTVHFTSADASAVLPADTTLGGGTGTFSATFKTAGTQTITATDTTTSAITGTSGNIAVAPGAAANFAVQALSPQTHGQQFQVSVTANDAYGNTATGYTGTIHFTSTDTGAVLPADQTLTSGVASPLPFVTLNTTGTQTVTVTDTVDATVTGVSNNITVN